ncbi:serine/threonine-protein kinase Nek8-like [Neocloeon triangulifer]|uniref:serine/threonine-protein kinase Nek8-like n=1 Tax=Neocloeon triangulifer TaxID=2078957 RepID=UPI00286F085E|nr:serine/threonine-protein kinase Nek8-like [Neocloeon triangulifer]
MADLIPGYDKVRTVGKGAFGHAVLYRRHSDGLMVVIKEVQLTELEATERQLALNEVQVLASLNHPNIIRYIRSFERGGSLLIEMEYADGGTLAQLLGPRNVPLSERAVLHIWSQLSAALAHMHSRGVLHRDLKTANVFLTSSLQVKVGDFGISKVLTSKAQAQTILGTPYYLSPEMCQGLEYGSKSDIWAAGCVLYEMMSLKKPFDGENLPALVARIIAGMYEPLDGERYTQGLLDLVASILQRDPEKRPSAAEICEERLPPLLLGLSRLHLSIRRNRTIVYQCSPTIESIQAVPLPPSATLADFSAGPDHCLALTSEGEIFEWRPGELPVAVREVRERRLRLVAAGLGFSMVGSESGVLVSWGQGMDGCLGHGDFENQTTPRIIETLLSSDIVQASCGNDHVLALDENGLVYTWGKTRLVGKEKIALPEKVEALANLKAKVVCAGPGCSAVVGEDFTLWVWGDNAGDRLGLDKPVFLGFKSKLAVANVPTKVAISARDVALGMEQAIVITPENRVVVIGGPSSGPVQGIKGPVKLAGVLDAGCIAATDDQVLYFWGRPEKPAPFFSLNLQGSDSNEEGDNNRFQSPKEVLAVYGPRLGDLQTAGKNAWLVVHTGAPLPPGHSTAAPEWLRKELKDE